MKKLASLLIGATMLISFSANASAAVVATAKVNKSVNFRADQSTSSKIYGLIKAGTVLPVEAANDYWVLVDYNGKTGYVSRSYVTVNESKPAPAPAPTPVPVPTPTPTPAPVQTSDLAAKIINTAVSYQGKVTYVFGKNDTTNLQLDCSSFTKLVFSKVGINLPWGSKVQSAQGTFVPKTDLKPGDLVFFSVSTPGQVNHVGIYMGNGQFINNLPNKGVIISDMNSSYWTSHYITGRHVTN